jgi:hypothetical protein
MWRRRPLTPYLLINLFVCINDAFSVTRLYNADMWMMNWDGLGRKRLRPWHPGIHPDGVRKTTKTLDLDLNTKQELNHTSTMFGVYCDNL